MQTVGGIKGCWGSMLCKQWAGLRAAGAVCYANSGWDLGLLGIDVYRISRLNQLNLEYGMYAAIFGL